MSVVVRVVGVIHGDDVGRDRRAQIVVVVGHDANELRALDHESRVTEEREPHLVRLELGEPQCGGRGRRTICGDEAGAIASHFRLGGRRLGDRLVRRRRIGRLRQGCRGQGPQNERRQGKTMDTCRRNSAEAIQLITPSAAFRRRYQKRQMSMDYGATFLFSRGPTRFPRIRESRRWASLLQANRSSAAAW